MMTLVTKTDRAIYKLGFVGLLVAAFSWGWNFIHFNNKK